MDDQPIPESELACGLILHRPQLPATGAIRSIHLYLDDQHIADLGQGETARVPTSEGPHLLRAQCRPLIGDEYPFILGAEETLRVEVFVDALDEIEIRLVEQPAS